MRRFALAVVAAAAVVTPARADDALPAAVLDDLKAATVFVKVAGGGVNQTGSGFVFRTDGDDALVVTNEHVITVEKPTDRRPTAIDVVFHSGRGGREKLLAAEVLAADPARDLTVLRVPGGKAVAKALDLAQKAEVRETMTVYTVGFPFGERLAMTKGNPTLTIGKGTVSSLREDDSGATTFVQIDGDINPGNSGGPVVDGRGRLVGVAVARIANSRIGLAIPAADVDAVLAGRPGVVAATLVRLGAAGVEFDVKLNLVDPFGQVTKAAVRVARKTGPDPTGKASARVALPDSELFPLTIDAKARIAVGRAKLAGNDIRAGTEFWMQPVYSTAAKADVLDGPTVAQLEAAAPARGLGGFPGFPELPLRPTLPGMPNFPGVMRPPGGTLPGRMERMFPGGSVVPTAPANPAAPAAPPVKPVEIKVPDPKPTGVEISTAELNVTGIEAKAVSIGVGAGPACLAWAADATAFYHADGAGTVRRVAYPAFTEAAALAVGRPVGWACVSAEGLVVTVPDFQEMWLLDPDTLAVKLRVPVGRAKRVAAAPGSAFGYAAETGFGPLMVIDLKLGKRVRQYESRDLADGVSFLPLDHAVLTGNGKFLLATGATGQLARFAVVGEKVRLEEVSARLIQGRFEGLCVSPKGGFVAAPSAAGNAGAAGYDRQPFGTFVFPVGDLKKPAVTLKTGSLPACVGYDGKAGLTYGQNADKQLIVMDGEGNKQSEFALTPGRVTEVRQFLVHPDGRKLLALAGPDGQTAAKVFSLVLP